MGIASPLPAPVAASCAALFACLLLGACGAGAGAGAGDGSLRSRRAGLERYLAQVEPIRLGVNRLLEAADPILGPYRERRISPALAARRIDALERRFAEYTVQIAGVSAPAPLGPVQAEYAHTYVLEDAYLSALVSYLAKAGDAHLPETQDQQRATIIAWRTRLTLVARRLGVALPADLQQAGRGEIAPSVSGAS